MRDSFAELSGVALIIQPVYQSREGNARSRLQISNRDDNTQLESHCASEAENQVLIFDGGFNLLSILPILESHAAKSDRD